MKVTTTKSKNAESFYITRSYINDEGKNTSTTVRKLGTLEQLLPEHGPTRDDVMLWAKEQARIETEKYRTEQQTRLVQISFRADQRISPGKQVSYRGGYLFLQYFYYGLGLDRICRKLRDRHKFSYDINAILSDLIYARILEPASKRASYATATEFLESPSYSLHDVYRALDVLGDECDLIQSEVYKNSHLLGKRNDSILYYDCTNYYFEIEQEDGDRRYGKSKQHQPCPIIQMGMFMDADGIPLAFTMFPGNSNEQTSLKPLEEKVLQDFGCNRFIYCSDAGLGSASTRRLNHVGKRAFIVTQSIRKLKKKDREWALDRTGFRRISDNAPVDISSLPEDDTGVYYKDSPYDSSNMYQRLIVTYSPKYARYQKTLRDDQIGRAEKMLENGKHRRNRKNQNDPARFIGKIAATENGEIAQTTYFLDEEKIEDEMLYDGLYAVTTDLLDDDVAEILKVSEGRWQIEECFRIMKSEFEARPVYLSRENRINAHFLICFLSLMIYRFLERELGDHFTCDQIISKLRKMNFASVQGQGFMPLYVRDDLTDAMHRICGFNTDYEFIAKSQMRNIQKKSKRRE